MPLSASNPELLVIYNTIILKITHTFHNLHFTTKCVYHTK